MSQFSTSAARQYAKANGIVILAFIRETYSGDVFGVSVKTCKRIDGAVYYTFGKLYHTLAEQFIYEQCGCATFTSENAVRLAAYKHFGIQ